MPLSLVHCDYQLYHMYSISNCSRFSASHMLEVLTLWASYIESRETDISRVWISSTTTSQDTLLLRPVSSLCLLLLMLQSSLSQLHRIRKKREQQKLVYAWAYELMTRRHVTRVNKWCIVSMSIAYSDYYYETPLHDGLQKCELCSRSRLVLLQVAGSIVYMFVHLCTWPIPVMPANCVTAYSE